MIDSPSLGTRQVSAAVPSQIQHLLQPQHHLIIQGLELGQLRLRLRAAAACFAAFVARATCYASASASFCSRSASAAACAGCMTQ